MPLPFNFIPFKHFDQQIITMLGFTECQELQNIMNAQWDQCTQDNSEASNKMFSLLFNDHKNRPQLSFFAQLQYEVTAKTF